MSLFQNRFRIETTRLDCWDYSKYGYYFVTICTKEKSNFFGEVLDEKVVLNKIGEKVKQIWLQIAKQYEGVGLDEFTIMPNHVHGIIFISRDFTNRDLINQVSTDNKITDNKIFIQNNPMQKDLSLGKIIRWFKAKTSYTIRHDLGITIFGWQSRYYEHIIRNQKALNKIREYIMLNPIKWSIDEENPQYTFKKSTL